MIKRDVNTFKLVVASVSRDITSAKTTQTRSKNPVQKQHLSLYIKKASSLLNIESHCFAA